MKIQEISLRQILNLMGGEATDADGTVMLRLLVQSGHTDIDEIEQDAWSAMIQQALQISSIGDLDAALRSLQENALRRAEIEAALGLHPNPLGMSRDDLMDAGLSPAEADVVMWALSEAGSVPGAVLKIAKI